jgi:starch phosphorylase
LLPEALESWPTSLMNKLLPRHLQIINLINWFHLSELAERGMTDRTMISSVSLIDESAEKRVRMGHLAFLGAHKVNGVSALHTELMRRTIFDGLQVAKPDKIVNKTNGISFRRWLHQANPGLTSLLTEVLGKRVCDDIDALHKLEGFADASDFVSRFAETRLRNKTALVQSIRRSTGISVDPSALLDVHIKRIHEYKRQLLNILERVALFQAIRARPSEDWVSRVKLFAGKAAADYTRAKIIIKLAHDVGRMVNSDPIVGHRLKVVFLPDYTVSLGEQIIPAADLSEQISIAGMEASGTGNMKLALNGALTIGTLDGANVEMRERVGAENFFIFGLTAVKWKKSAEPDRPGARPRRPARDSLPSSKALNQARSRPRNPIDFATWSTPCWTSTRSWSQPTSTPIGTLSAPSITCGSNPHPGGAPPSPPRREWAGPPQTARSANTQTKSGG